MLPGCTFFFSYNFYGFIFSFTNFNQGNIQLFNNTNPAFINITSDIALVAFNNQAYIKRKDGSFFQIGTGGSSTGDGINFIKLSNGSVTKDANKSVSFVSNDSSLTLTVQDSNTDNFQVNKQSLLPSIIDTTKGLEVLANKIALKLSTNPNNSLSFDQTGALYSTGSGGGADPRAVYSINSVMPTATVQNIDITSPDSSINIVNNQTTNTIEITTAGGSTDAIKTINNQSPDSNKNLNLFSKNTSLTFNNLTSNAVDINVDPNKIIDSAKGLGVAAGTDKIQVKVSTQQNNNLSIQSDGSLYVGALGDSDIRTINTVRTKKARII